MSHDGSCSGAVQADNTKARELLADGSYRRLPVEPGQPLLRSQERFLELAAQSARRRLKEVPPGSGQVPFIEAQEIPMTATGKLQRFRLVEIAKQRLATLPIGTAQSSRASGSQQASGRT